MSEASKFARLRPLDGDGLRRRITEVVARDLPLLELSQTICKLIAEHLGAGSAVLALGDGQPLSAAGLYISGDMRAAALPAELHTAFEQAAAVRTETGGDACLAIPLRVGPRVLGALGARRPAAAPFAPDEQALLESCAPLVAAAARIALDSAAREEFAEQSTTDALTGVGNRRKFEQTLATEWKRCARRGDPLALVLLDIDFFKAYNDRYGHLGGDTCLQTVARACDARVTRAGDVFCRYGGEEFVAIFPGTDQAGAVVVAEALRGAIADLALPNPDSTLGILSISLGAAAFVPGAGKPADLIALADACLYDAKRAGRNRVAAAGYRSAAPAAQRIHSASHSNLPAKTSQFYGRARELAELGKLLEQTRLLTIAGPGGVGKTRIALELGRPLVERKPVWFVDLAPVTEPDAVGAALCDAAGIRNTSGASPADALAAVLESEGALVVLDNCEHLVAECARLTEELLNTCPALHILTTSREPLGVDGEVTYRLPVLSLPAEQHRITAEEALAFDAVRLFLERAKLAAASFDITDENAARTARICRRLDGVPLAIELAAAQLTTFTLDQLEQKLDDRLRLLAASDGTAQTRQRTLESLIRWGYELLTHDEQRVLTAVSVLGGAWPLSAAVAVDGQLDEIGMLTAIGALVDKSLLFVEPVGDENWYRLLESTREFAARRLAESTYADEARRRLIAHYRDVLTALEANPAELEARAAREYGNIQTALGYALDDRLDPSAGIAVTIILSGFRGKTYKTADTIRWAQRGLEHTAPDSAEHRLLLLQLGSAFIVANELDRAEQICNSLMDAFERSGDRAGYGRARRTLASCLCTKGEVIAAKEHMLALIDDSTTDSKELEINYNFLGVMCNMLNQFEEALEYFKQSLYGTPTEARTAINKVNLVCSLLFLKRFDEAIPLLEDVLKLPESTTGTFVRAHTLSYYAACMLFKGNYPEARQYLRASFALAFPELRTQFTAQAIYTIAVPVYFFATYAFARHDYTTAIQLFTFTEAQKCVTSIYSVKPFAEETARMLSAIQSEIGTDAYAEYLAAGKTMNIAQVENLVYSL